MMFFQGSRKERQHKSKGSCSSVQVGGENWEDSCYRLNVGSTQEEVVCKHLCSFQAYD